MKKSRLTIAAAALAFGACSPMLAAHDTDLPDGHVLPDINYGFKVVGRDLLAGVQTGRYTDVWSHKGYAYVGTFQEPTCSRDGVFIVDIGQVLANHPSGKMDGAVVAEVRSAPNTRVNDVKVTTVKFQNQTRDILILTEEKCGTIIGSGKKQLGKGGISLYDVTNPSRPHALKQHELGTEIHNTYAWQGDDGRSYLIAVDDINVDDVIIVDITKPQSPKEVGRVGVGFWLAGDYPEIADDGQLFTGVFAAPLLHDVWVQKIGGRWQALLSYWDAGFVTLDVHDPNNPFVIGDSTYPDPDPIYGTSPAEGNAHAAVYGGDEGQFIWGGDEDFDPFRNQVIDPAGGGHLATQGSDVPQITPESDVSGVGVYVGLGCSPIGAAPNVDAIAVIQRGACAFTTKAQNAEAAGYQAAVVFNHSFGCESSVSMLVEAGIPAMFVPRSDGFEGTQVGTVALDATFDGWGYFHVLNNLQQGATTLAPPSVPGESPDNRDILDVDYLGEMGYFAPRQLLDEELATGAGDLTMHIVEGDPLTAGEEPTFDAGPRSFIAWYSLGMRAVEYRPGHWHTGNGGVFSWNVHEVGQFIADDGSNFWGVHVDEHDGKQIILAPTATPACGSSSSNASTKCSTKTAMTRRGSTAGVIDRQRNQKGGLRAAFFYSGTGLPGDPICLSAAR